MPGQPHGPDSRSTCEATLVFRTWLDPETDIWARIAENVAGWARGVSPATRGATGALCHRHFISDSGTAI